MRKSGYGKIFLEAAKRQGWIDASGVVCALSGGGDSVALLWLLKTFFNGTVVAAHLDHCTRNGGSGEDAEFVRRLCRDWGIKCEVLKVDVCSMRRRGESFEMAGRRFRYKHFSDTAEAYGLPFIALGHNADDVVETQIMNLTRGAGIAGLRGMPERRGNIVRPVIDFTRRELRDLLIENSAPWRDDYTNGETDYARNKVRNILIPWIKENLNPGFEGVMKGLAREAAEDSLEKEARASVEIEKIKTDIPPAVTAWRTEGLDRRSDIELASMLRLEGARLGLPVLDRPRTKNLIALIRRGGSWRFQWASDIEVCYSKRALGWLHRADIARGKNKSEKIAENNLPWWAR